MGFFGKLFGIDNSGTNDSGSDTAGTLPMLRTQNKGGYDKQEVLMLIDALNNEISALEEAVKARGAGAHYELPPEKDPVMPRQVSRGGFSEEDTVKCVNVLSGKIKELRDQLR